MRVCNNGRGMKLADGCMQNQTQDSPLPEKPPVDLVQQIQAVSDNEQLLQQLSFRQDALAKFVERYGRHGRWKSKNSIEPVSVRMYPFSAFDIKLLDPQHKGVRRVLLARVQGQPGLAIIGRPLRRKADIFVL